MLVSRTLPLPPERPYLAQSFAFELLGGASESTLEACRAQVSQTLAIDDGASGAVLSLQEAVEVKQKLQRCFLRVSIFPNKYLVHPHHGARSFRAGAVSNMASEASGLSYFLLTIKHSGIVRADSA